MTARHLAVVWNPAKTARDKLESALDKAAGSAHADPAVLRFETTWFETSKDDPGQGAAARAIEAGADVIVVAGGDGTVRAVAEHLAEADAAVDLGIVPLGTGNLLARNLGVPLGSLSAAFKRVLAGEAHPIDLGWLEIDLATGTERHAFAVLAGFGLDAQMIVETDDDLKDKVGWLAYVESLGRALSASDTLDIRYTVDDGPRRDERVHTLIVGNCGTLQGGITLLPDADPSDGELDLLVLGAEGVAGWADTLRNMVWDNGVKRLVTRGSRARGAKAQSAKARGPKAESSDNVTHGRLLDLRLQLTEPRMFEIDGEDLGEATRVAVTIQAGAVRVR